MTLAHPSSASAQRVRLLGLDFGSTTSSMVLAEVGVGQHSLSGRMGFSEPQILARSEPVFTPFDAGRLDPQRLVELINGWLADCDLQRSPAFAGAALITGLAARSDNAAALTRVISERVGDSLIAAADDPRLESWLAFMGNCATLSRARAQTAVINFDIGGGTTNPALGLNGAVSLCGCHYIGARHLRFEPGGYRLVGGSEFGQRLLALLGIDAQPGDTLGAGEIARIVGWMVQGLEALLDPHSDWFARAPHRAFEQVAFRPPPLEAPLVTFSGGVGELIYRHQAGEPWPATTCFGDLGVDLAQAIVASPRLSRSLTVRPETAGRATVMGLTLHSCDISGSSLYLPDSSLLPLRDLPILARLPLPCAEPALQQALVLAKSRPQGACIQLLGGEALDLNALRDLGRQLRAALLHNDFPPQQPLVLLVESNVGKTLGHYATDWGQSSQRLLVIDEIPDRHAQFIHIGQPHQQVVPVSFFGIR